MTDLATLDDYGVVTEPATLTIIRLLPGPLERVWDYLTKSDFRRKWLAAGDMELKVGATFEFVWRNDELSDQPPQRPEGVSGDHQLVATITELEPMKRLGFTWGDTGGVTFELAPRGDDVLLTLTHRRVMDPNTLLNVSAGWHAHLEVLADRLDGRAPAAFWPAWSRLKQDYARRLGA